MDSARNKTVFLVITLAAFVAFFRLGSVTLFDVDEAVFAQASKEMVQSGDWITPTYNGVNRYDKPILIYWLMAGSYRLFGINEFAARIPSAAAAFLLALAVFFFVRRCLQEERAFFAALSLIVSFYFLVYSHSAVTDMTLALFIALSLFSFFLSLSEHSPRARTFLLACFYLFSALAFLTKGLIGIVFPFGIAFLYLIVAEGMKGIRKLISLPGICTFVIVGAPWFIAQIMINGREFIDLFFLKHHFVRYTGVISGHRGPVYYFIPVIMLGLFPWIAFLPAGIRNALAERKSPASGQPGLLLFALLWFSVIFVFFSFSTTKLPNYILSAIPAATILIASGMPSRVKDTPDMRSVRSWRGFGSMLMAVVALGFSVALVVAPKYLSTLGVHAFSWIYAAALVVLIIGVILVDAAFRGRVPIRTLAMLMICLFVILSIKALPMASEYLQGTLHRYSLIAKEKLPAGDRIIAYGINYPSIVFYSGHTVVQVGNTEGLGPLLAKNTYLLAITKVKKVAELEGAGFRVLEQDGQYAILERK